MSKLLFSGILILVAGSVFGQTSKPMNLPVFDAMPAHLGYSVGINWMGFTYKSVDGVGVDIKQNTGININLVTSFKMARFVDLRVLPGIQFGQRDMVLTDLEKGTTWDARIESVFIDMPILFKYRAQRVNNYAPYLIAGVNPRVDLTGGEIEDWKPAQRLVKAFDIFPELGVGLDFYLEKVKMSAELKFSVGMLNVYNLAPDEPDYQLFNKAFERLMSRMVVLSIHIG